MMCWNDDVETRAQNLFIYLWMSIKYLQMYSIYNAQFLTGSLVTSDQEIVLQVLGHESLTVNDRILRYNHIEGLTGGSGPAKTLLVSPLNSSCRKRHLDMIFVAFLRDSPSDSGLRAHIARILKKYE